MTKRRRHNNGIFWAIAGGAVALVAILLAVSASGSLIFIRAAGLLGYIGLFLAILSSAYLRQLVRLFGRSFLKIHHIISIAGLVLISLHPIGWAIMQRSVTSVLPRFGSWATFWMWAGPPAYDLILIAVVTSFLRRQVKPWRTLHILNYVAFVMGSVHALLLGSDTRYLLVRIIIGLMLLAVVAVFIKRHVVNTKKPAKSRAS